MIDITNVDDLIDSRHILEYIEKYKVDVEDITVLKKYHHFIDLDNAMNLKEKKK